MLAGPLRPRGAAVPRLARPRDQDDEGGEGGEGGEGLCTIDMSHSVAAATRRDAVLALARAQPGRMVAESAGRGTQWRRPDRTRGTSSAGRPGHRSSENPPVSSLSSPPSSTSPRLGTIACARPSLVTRLAEARARLIVVSAPAGAGKTTLLTSWHAAPDRSREFAWLSLDERDNDPVCFWNGVLAALRTVEPSSGAGSTPRCVLREPT